VERGLALVEEVLTSCPDWPRALVLRAKLKFIRAGTEAHADAQQLWRTQASDDLSRAFTKNPHLKVGWKP
jgi:serine/threonine-protein kinase